MSRLIGRKLLMSRGSGAVRIVCARFYRPLPRRVKSDRLLVDRIAASYGATRITVSTGRIGRRE
jgi:hypothetical protein